MSAKYKVVADAMWPDVMDFLVSKHHNDIKSLYEKLFTAYLKENYGALTPAVKADIIKYLMKNIIT